MRIFTAAIIATLTSTSASAAGFAPWNQRAIESTPDSVQATLAPGFFYRSNDNAALERPDPDQKEVVIVLWYPDGQV